MNTFSMRYDPDLIENQFKTGGKKMNEKLEKTINWINFVMAALGIITKVIQEIVEILPNKEENND